MDSVNSINTIPNSNQNCSSRLPCGVCMILGSKCPLYFGATFEGPTCSTHLPTTVTTTQTHERHLKGGQTNG